MRGPGSGIGAVEGFDAQELGAGKMAGAQIGEGRRVSGRVVDMAGGEESVFECHPTVVVLSVCACPHVCE